MKRKLWIVGFLLTLGLLSLGALQYPPLQLDLSLDTQSCSDVTGPPCDGGTLRIIKRFFINDNPTHAQTFKNSLFSVNHLANNTSTSTNNQDRAIGFETYNDPNDSSPHYAMEGIQGQLTISGNPTFYGSPDGEAAAASFQVDDSHQNLTPSPMKGVVGVTSRVFRRGNNWGSCPYGACWIGFYGAASNNSVNFPGGNQIIAGGMFTSQNFVGATGTAALVGVGGYFPAPNANNRYMYNRGIYVQDFGLGINDYSVYSLGKNYLKQVILLPHTPGANNDGCKAGEIWFDENYIYGCTATNHIKRAALKEFSEAQ